MDKKINLTSVVIVVVLVAGISFFGGMKFGESKGLVGGPMAQGGLQRGGPGNFAPDGARTVGTGQPSARTGNRAAGGGFSSGEILLKDTKSITIKLATGGSQIIFFSTSTPIMKSTGGTSADLIVGESVMVSGPANQDGSINAQTIQIRSTPVPATPPTQ